PARLRRRAKAGIELRPPQRSTPAPHTHSSLRPVRPVSCRAISARIPRDFKPAMVVDFGTMKRWHLIVAAILLASAVGLAQGGRGQRGQGGGQAAGGNRGGRGVQSTADLTVV